jgi:hypothetical protein
VPQAKVETDRDLLLGRPGRPVLQIAELCPCNSQRRCYLSSMNHDIVFAVRIVNQVDLVTCPLI